MYNMYNIEQILADGYIRVSTLDQANDGFGLEAQTNKIIQHCASKGIKLNKIYCDAGLSGKDTIHRKEFNKMMEDVKSGKINKIVTLKIDRISRSVADFALLLQDLEKYDCSIDFVNEPIDVSGINGKMMAGILSVFAQFEREVIVDRTTTGMEEAANQGHFGGKPPLGYMKEMVNGEKGKKWVINEEEAEVVREIFSLCLKGKSYNDISSIMQKEHSDMISYTRKNRETGEIKKIHRSWTDASICTILNNKTYIGIREHRKNMKNKKTIEIRNIIPPIISEEVFYDCQENIIRNKRNYYRNKKYLFMQKLVCPKCGRIMACKGTKKKTGEEYLYYKCKDCKTNFREDLIEEALAEELTTMLELYLILESNFVPIDSNTAQELSKGRIDNTIRYALDSIIIDNRLYLESDCAKKFWNMMNYEVKCSFIYEYIDKIKIKKHIKNGKPYIEILDLEFRNYVIKKFKEMFSNNLLDDVFIVDHEEISATTFKNRDQADQYLTLLGQKYNIKIHDKDSEDWCDNIFKIISIKNKCVCDKDEVLYVELLPQYSSILDKVDYNICEEN